MLRDVDELHRRGIDLIGESIEPGTDRVILRVIALEPMQVIYLMARYGDKVVVQSAPPDDRPHVL